MRTGFARTAVLAASLAFCPAGSAQEEPAEVGFEPMGMERAKIDDLDVIALVHFAVGSTELTARARAVLDEVAAQLAGAADGRIEIGGHTDSSGAESLNHQLSQQRAEAVRAHLVARGLAAGRFVVIGYGPNQPLDSNASAEGRALNRRAHLKAPD